MQQVKVEGFRFGRVTGWNDSVFHKGSDQLEGLTADGEIRARLAKSGRFPFYVYGYPKRGVGHLFTVFYNRFQRSRRKSGLVRRLNSRQGALATQNVRAFVMTKSHYQTLKAKFYRRLVAKKSVPPVPSEKETHKRKRKGRHDEATGKLRGWADIERQSIRPSKRHPLDTGSRRLRVALKPRFPRRLVEAQNVAEYVDLRNTSRLLRHYTRKRFNKLRYKEDVRRGMYVARHFREPKLLAGVLTLGLSRHAGGRQQKFFINMVKTIMERLMLSDKLTEMPIWLIKFAGKFDAKMRRAQLRLKGGYTRFQEVDTKQVAARYRAATKFGTTSVTIFVRDLN